MTNNQAIVGFIASFAAGCAVMWAVNKNPAEDVKPDGSKASTTKAMAAAPLNPGAVKAEFYVMSQCPYGVQAINGVKEAFDKLGPDLDFQLEFIGDIEGDKLTSMHGESEVTGNIAQLCAKKVSSGKYMELIACQNKEMKSVATNWKSCAEKVGIPVAPLQACIEGPDGKALLKASFEKAKARGASGSPTIYIGGTEYQGRRSADHYLRAICAAHKGPKTPDACKNLPEIPKVMAILIGDKRCADCPTDDINQGLSSRLANPDIRRMDIADEAAKKLYEEVGGGNLPILLFDESLDKDAEAKKAFAGGLKPAGKYQKLDLGAQWNPKCADDGGCKLPECEKTIGCRPETPGTLEVFVMSQCPYGVMALDAMKEVLTNFKNKIDFKVHFIANGTAKDGFEALHGQPEVDENIRELCAIKHYGKDFKYMNYIWCRNPNIRDTNWESCAKDGIAAATIKKCVETDGKTLHEKDIAIANSMGIGGSPTWLVNGKFKFQGIDAETVRKNFCAHNEKTAGCENTLSGPKGGAPAGGGCGK